MMNPCMSTIVSSNKCNEIASVVRDKSIFTRFLSYRAFESPKGKGERKGHTDQNESFSQGSRSLRVCVCSVIRSRNISAPSAQNPAIRKRKKNIIECSSLRRLWEARVISAAGKRREIRRKCPGNRSGIRLQVSASRKKRNRYESRNYLFICIQWGNCKKGGREKRERA